MVLQTLVEGMVLEAHVSSENATETPPVHLVELYSQYGSQVCGCVCGCGCVRLFYVTSYPSSFCRRPYLSTESWWTRVSLCGRRTRFNPVITITSSDLLNHLFCTGLVLLGSLIVACSHCFSLSF